MSDHETSGTPDDIPACDFDTARELFGQLPDIVVVPCDMCEGRGDFPDRLHLICPKCEGCGKSTAHAVAHD